jgi:hypothetical protein
MIYLAFCKARITIQPYYNFQRGRRSKDIMKRFVYGLAALAVVVALTGCAKKQQALEEMQQPMAPEDLSRLKNEAQPAAGAPSQTVPQETLQSSKTVSETPLAKLPPSGPYKPTNVEIQTALKNAGFYSGAIDGKIGPISKKAIEEFQKANNLNPDGKVGPKTWAVLEKYLNPPAAITSATAPPVKKKR